MTHLEKSKKQRIKDLIKLNDELENYFKNTIIPQLFVDADLILQKFTPPAMKQFNFKPGDLGKSFTNLLDNIRYSTIIQDVNEVILTGEIMEKEVQTTDGRWFQMNIIPYKVDKENRTNGVIITFVDITDRIATLRDLEKLIASHENFIYSVSHDLKSPLANIESLVKFLVPPLSDTASQEELQERQRLVAMLEKSVSLMKNIINELSDIARVENQLAQDGESVKLEEIINDVRLTLYNQIIQSQAKISLQIEEPEVIYSRKNLRSIIFNLVSNAVKYRSPERSPEITLTSKAVDGHIHLTVRDNGIGIAEEKQNLLFKPYSRLERKVDGTGIGLYLIKRIVENAGGKILVDSRCGEGSEFTVMLRKNPVKVADA